MPCVRTVFCKLDVRRKSIVSLALSQDNGKISRKIFGKSDPWLAAAQIDSRSSIEE